jgi:TonB family protein
MKILARPIVVGVIVVAAALLSASTDAWTQEASIRRTLLEHATPPCPALARSMGVAGTVKMEALVAPDGSVKTVDVLGGHPVLAQAATNAVRRWRWEKAPHETREVVQIKFSPAE